MDAVDLKETQDEVTRLHWETLQVMGEEALVSKDFKERKAFIEMARDAVQGLKVKEAHDPYANLPTINVVIRHGHITATQVPMADVIDVNALALSEPSYIDLPALPTVLPQDIESLLAD